MITTDLFWWLAGLVIALIFLIVLDRLAYLNNIYGRRYR